MYCKKKNYVSQAPSVLPSSSRIKIFIAFSVFTLNIAYTTQIVRLM